MVINRSNTSLLTPQVNAIIEELMVINRSRNSRFLESRMFITVLKRAIHLSLF
jgi:hypothetical protein